jgi:cyclopropane-fatty-acyl-phospholipid synthase
MSLRRRLLSLLRKRFTDHPLPVRLAFWDGEVFDLSPAPTVTLTLRAPRTVRDLLFGRFDRLGDAYVAGDILVEGDPREILRAGIELAEHIGKARWLAPLVRGIRPISFRHSRAADARAIAHHYDVSDDFYRAFLDARMIYSCAYFCRGDEDIDRAQEQKLAHICRKLRLTPGERVLDIGCGWGGLLEFAASRYGIAAVGVTNSRAQCDAARARIAAAGLGDRVVIRHTDYRDVEGGERFDKIVSVGMYEHVGARNWPVYLQCVARLLKPGGVLLNHGIVLTDADGRPQGPPGGEFIDRYVFPGGELANLPRLLTEIARCGLETADVEDLRPHYARTLALWLARLEANREAIVAAGGIARYRIWRIYLAGMAQAFERGWLSVAQVVAYKRTAAGPAPRPWTRRHQYGASEIAGPCAPAPRAAARDAGRGSAAGREDGTRMGAPASIGQGAPSGR